MSESGFLRLLGYFSGRKPFSQFSRKLRKVVTGFRGQESELPGLCDRLGQHSLNLLAGKPGSLHYREPPGEAPWVSSHPSRLMPTLLS